MNRRDLLKTLPAVAVTPFFLNGMEAGATEPDGAQGIVLQPWQEHLLKAFTDLRPRVENLKNFILRDPVFVTLSPEHQNGLKRQYAFMRHLEIVLEAALRNNTEFRFLPGSTMLEEYSIYASCHLQVPQYSAYTCSTASFESATPGVESGTPISRKS